MVVVTSEDKGGKKPGGVLGDLVKAESMFQLAVAMPLGCLVGWGLGTLLDRHFHTTWMAVAGILLGAAAGVVQLIATAQRFMKKDGE